MQPDAPLEIIKASYRTLMHKLRQHPDLGGDNEHAAILNDAYAVLSDVEKRKQYDANYTYPTINDLREGTNIFPEILVPSRGSFWESLRISVSHNQTTQKHLSNSAVVGRCSYGKPLRQCERYYFPLK